MRSYRRYLKEQGLANSTISQYLRHAGGFLEWMGDEGLTQEEVTYNDILGYIEYRRSCGDSSGLINRGVVSIRRYFSFFQLKEKKADMQNPASGIYIRGKSTKMISGVLPFEKLEEIYHGYPASRSGNQRSAIIENPGEIRNKVLLGLLVYQGVTTDELHRLEVDHVKFSHGKVYIPGSKKSNSRLLALDASQVPVLQEYITQVRPVILSGGYWNNPGRKPGPGSRVRKTDQLLLSVNGSRNIKSTMHHLFRKLQKQHPDIRDARQIRQSVIIHWLGRHNLRQVQYMAGHRYVSSTERYRRNNIEDLQKEVTRYHPLDRLKGDFGDHHL